MSNEECPASRKSLFAVSSSRLTGLRFSILFESMENNDINHGGFQQLKKQASVDKYSIIFKNRYQPIPENCDYNIKSLLSVV